MLNKIKANSTIKKVVASCLCVAIIAMLFASCTQNVKTGNGVTKTNLEKGSFVISVNPEIKVEYDKQGNVTKLVAENEDGEKILASYDNFIGKKSNQVVREIIIKIKEAGYFISEVDNSVRNINIEFTTGSYLPSDDFTDVVTNEIYDVVGEFEFDTQVVNKSDENIDKNISGDRALEIALADAGVAKADVRVIKTVSYYNHGNKVWKVIFLKDNTKYYYQIEAATEKIADKEVNGDSNDDTATTTTTTTTKVSKATQPSDKSAATTTTTQNSNFISKDKALEYLAKYTGVSKSNFIIDKIEFDYDHGRSVWEVDVCDSTYEYEADIDAITGKILDFEKDRCDDSRCRSNHNNHNNNGNHHNNSNNNTTVKITQARATEIALNKAGVAKNNTTQFKIELDDNAWEIEFKVSGVEYEFEIDVYSGKILKYEVDR